MTHDDEYVRFPFNDKTGQASAFVYRPPKYEGPIAVDCTVSQAIDEYHKKSTLYFMTQMTQEEFLENTKNRPKEEYKYNVINYENN